MNRNLFGLIILIVIIAAAFSSCNTRQEFVVLYTMYKGTEVKKTSMVVRAQNSSLAKQLCEKRTWQICDSVIIYDVYRNE